MLGLRRAVTLWQRRCGTGLELYIFACRFAVYICARMEFEPVVLLQHAGQNASRVCSAFVFGSGLVGRSRSVMEFALSFSPPPPLAVLP